MKGGEFLVSRNIQFPDDLYKRLQEIAKEKGVTISAIIKIACDEYLRSQGK